MQYTKNSLDQEGRSFLSDRGLCLTTAEKMGVHSANGEIAFPYVFNGEVVRTKYRNMENKKKMRFNSNGNQETKIPFWNQQIWPVMDRLIITEGELDCVALTQLGPNKVVSLPGGAGSVDSVFKSQFEYLQKFDLIYIAFDMDEAGNKAAELAKKFIPPKKYKRILFPAKDANDWIKENSYIEQKDLEKLMINAQKICIDQITHVNDSPDTFLIRRDPGVSTGWKALDLILGGIRQCEVTVVCAESGVGKTTFCLNLMCNLAMKRAELGSWINSWEMSYDVIMRKIASIALKKKFKFEAFSKEDEVRLRKWRKENNIYVDVSGVDTRADIIDLHKQIELAAKVFGVKHILLDHLDYITSGSKDRAKHEIIFDIVHDLHRIAKEFKVHIVLIAHPKQIEPGKRVTINDLRGGASIRQYADNVILLHKYGTSTSPDNRMDVEVVKNREVGIIGTATLKYDVESDSYGDNTIHTTISSD